ncbi:hypothetical protein A9R05_29825 [Burkholderia sp. KK1]|nr:hypothetical protein A9R05_29825 [Burkholderia sp. KK1]
MVGARAVNVARRSAWRRVRGEWTSLERIEESNTMRSHAPICFEVEQCIHPSKELEIAQRKNVLSVHACRLHTAAMH